MIAIALLATLASPFWNDLGPGKYDVGFRVMYARDHRHPWSASADRPIRISVWYPASVSTTPRMTYGEYLHHDGPADFQTFNEQLDKIDAESWLSDLHELVPDAEETYKRVARVANRSTSRCAARARTFSARSLFRRQGVARRRQHRIGGVSRQSRLCRRHRSATRSIGSTARVGKFRKGDFSSRRRLRRGIDRIACTLPYRFRSRRDRRPQRRRRSRCRTGDATSGSESRLRTRCVVRHD